MNQESSVTVAIVSDTHDYLDARIAEIISECDYAVHAGDIGSHDVLRQMRPKISTLAVAGNNDFVGAWPAGQQARRPK